MCYIAAVSGRFDLMKKTVTVISAVLILGGALFLAMPKQEPRMPQDCKLQFTAMGTTAAITFLNVPAPVALEAAQTVRETFRLVTECASIHDKKSELSRLNASAYDAPFACSGMLWQMILEAERAWHFSGGAFDITVKPLMDLWGFYRKRGSAPSPEEIASAKQKVGFDKLELDKVRKTIRFKVSGMALDLGGIAKGYALDFAAAQISRKVPSGVLDLGGNLKFLASPPPGKQFYLVGIRDPGKPDQLKQQMLQCAPGTAVSTSGDYERKVVYGDREYGHIMDPQQGCPPRMEHAATVCCTSATRADWLSTALYLRGSGLMEKIKKTWRDCRVELVKK